MKRIISLILVVIMALSCSLMLGSCELLEQFLSDTKKDPEEVKDTTVTEEEWNVALAIINFTVHRESETMTKTTVTGAQMGTMEGETIERSTGIQKQNETAQYSKNEYESKRVENGETDSTSYGSESYLTYDPVEDTWYRILENKTTGEWEGYDFGKSAIDDLGRMLFVDGTENTFENFTYDEEEKAYVRDVKIPGMGESDGVGPRIDTAKLYLYFENNNLVKAVMRAEGVNSGEVDFQGETASYTATASMTATILISDHGTTTITVPEYTID